MGRPLRDVVAAWLHLLPAFARVTLRRVRALAGRVLSGRALAGRRSVTVLPITADTPVGRIVVETGFVRPVVLDDQRVGWLSTHDDAGTSSTEASVELHPAAGVAVAVAVIDVVAGAAFARGNHRTAWSVRDGDVVVLDALQELGFTHEGQAAPPAGHSTTWQLWSRLSTDDPV